MPSAFYHSVSSWQGGAIATGLACRKIFLSETFFSKNTIFAAGNSHYDEFRGKIEISSTHNVLSRKFATACRNDCFALQNEQRNT